MSTGALAVAVTAFASPPFALLFAALAAFLTHVCGWLAAEDGRVEAHQ